MRLFAGDHFARLAVQSGDLPQPWVMPSGLPRAHRDRLAELLAQALRALDPSLRLVQLRWAERHFLLSGRIVLPSSVLVWWRVDAVPVVEPQAVVLDGSKITPGLALYDFDQEVSLPMEAWLGPLKMAVLHRILDRLLDDRPVAGSELVADAVRELSTKLISPIDLVDAAEAMVGVEAQGEGIEAAKAEAVGRVIAGRVAPGRVEVAVRAVFAAGREQALGDEEREALRKAGFVDSVGLQPILDLLRDDQVLRRTLMQIAVRGRLEGSIADLAPGLFPEERILSSQTSLEIISPQVPGQLDGHPFGLPEPHAAAVRQALRLVERGDTEAGSRLLLRLVQQRMDKGWVNEDLRTAGRILLDAAMQDDVRRGQKMHVATLERILALYEAASELLERAGALRVAATALCRAGLPLGALSRYPEAAALYERGCTLARAAGDQAGLAVGLYGLAEMRRRMGHAQEAVEKAEESARLFHDLGMRTSEGMTLRSLGDAFVQLQNLDQAREAYERSISALDDAEGAIYKVSTLLSQARLWQREGKFKDASDALEKALLLSRDHKDRLQEALAHEALGQLSLYRSEPLRAREAYEEAASIYHEFGALRGEARVLEQLGDVRASMNDLALARDAYDAALLLTGEMGDRGWEAKLRFKCAGLRLRSGDHDGALQEYGEALQLYEEIGDRDGQLDTLMEIGNLEALRAAGRDASGALS